MIAVYEISGSQKETCRRLTPGEALPPKAVWIDLLLPSEEEVRAVEAGLGITLPSRAEMQEIEASSRLYEKEGALYMTSTVVVKGDTPNPETAHTSFILAGHRLITLRYVESAAFRSCLEQGGALRWRSGEEVFLGLFDAIVGRMADVLEVLDVRLENLASEVFAMTDGDRRRGPIDYRESVRRIGSSGRTTMEVHESLASLDRMTAFFVAHVGATEQRRALEAKARMIGRDIRSLREVVMFLSSEAQFLLDATLGMINTQQNRIITVLSVVAAVFLPPTLIASIYGMNFRHMPELDWWWAYPLALLLMAVTAIFPYLYFKRRGWV